MWVHSPDGRLHNLRHAARLHSPTMTSHSRWFIAADMPGQPPTEDIGPFEDEAEAKAAFRKIVEALKVGDGFVAL